MGLPETLKGVRLGGCRFTARGGKIDSDANLGVSARDPHVNTLPRPAAAAAPPPPPPYNLDEEGGAPARGTHMQALNPKP